MVDLNGAETMKSAAFASETKRIAEDVIGARTSQTDPNVGPGTYSPDAWGSSIAGDQLKAVNSLTSQKQLTARPGEGAIGFGTGAKARELPHEHDQEAERTPGPGSYDPKLTHMGFEHDMSELNGAETMKSAPPPPEHSIRS